MLLNRVYLISLYPLSSLILSSDGVTMIGEKANPFLKSSYKFTNNHPASKNGFLCVFYNQQIDIAFIGRISICIRAKKDYLVRVIILS